MAFTVEFSLRVRRDIDEIVAYIQADSPVNATRWRQRLEQKMASLGTMPEACGLAPESEVSRFEVRQLLHGRYRVLFTIRGLSVSVLTIRHSARRSLSGEELNELKSNG